MCELKTEIEWKTIKNYWTIHFIFCLYKMYLILPEGYKNARVHVLIKKKLVKFGQAWKMYKMVSMLRTCLI